MSIRNCLRSASMLLVLLTGLSLLTTPVLAQEKRFDALKLEGKKLRKVNPDDARLLGIVAMGIRNEAQKGKPLPAEQEALFPPGQRAYLLNDFDTAYRYAMRLILLRDGATLGEATELGTSYDFQLDRRIVAPGESLTAALEPLYALPEPLSGTYEAKLSLTSLKGEVIESLPAISIKEAKDFKASVPTGKLKPGKYLVGYQLVSPAGKVVVGCSRDFVVNAEAGPRSAALRKQLDEIKNSRSASESMGEKAALESLEYIVGIVERSCKEYVVPMAKKLRPMTIHGRGSQVSRLENELFDLDKDLNLAEALATDLRAGKNPLATRIGDMRFAYRSKVDNTLQPFRVFVPKSYNAEKPNPLIIALHGATGDENSYMDRYFEPGTTKNLLKKLAEERGYLLATPNGRGPYGGYINEAEKDVLDVLDRMKKLYNVNPKEVFLTGHSMGAGGTWSIGFKHAEQFAALAPVAGAPMAVGLVSLKNAPDMPVLFSYAGKDTLATPENCKRFADVAKKTLKNLKAVEYPDDDHFVIGVTCMPAIFDFFDARRGVGK